IKTMTIIRMPTSNHMPNFSKISEYGSLNSSRGSSTTTKPLFSLPSTKATTVKGSLPYLLFIKETMSDCDHCCGSSYCTFQLLSSCPSWLIQNILRSEEHTSELQSRE